MQKILCDSKTCTNYSEGSCKSEKIEMKNHEVYNFESKKYDDFEKCGSYQYDRDWMYKRA